VKPKNLEQNGHIDFGSEHVSKPTTGSHYPNHKLHPKLSKTAALDPRVKEFKNTMPEPHDTRGDRNGQLV
jgi:hypothetical protein